MKTKGKKKKKSMIKLLREIRDKISLETQDMSFEEMNEYLRKRMEEAPSIAAEPKAPYRNR